MANTCPFPLLSSSLFHSILLSRTFFFFVSFILSFFHFSKLFNFFSSFSLFQVPRLLLTETSKVLVVQPRRLVVTSLAKRLSRERGSENLEESDVGFRIGGVSSANSDKASILVVTYGILLNMLEGGPLKFTHVVLDEIHERGFEFDVGLAIICTKMRFPDLRPPKLVLMSATVDISPLQEYCKKFGLTNGQVRVERRVHNVQQYFLDDFQTRFSLPRSVFDPPEEKGFGPKLTYPRREALLKLLVHLHQNTPVSAGIIVFLTGISLISEFSQLISENLPTDKRKYEVIPLHSSYPLEEQQKAVTKMNGRRKVFFLFFFFFFPSSLHFPFSLSP